MPKRSAPPSAPRKKFRARGGMAPSTDAIARQALALAKRNASSVEVKRYDITDITVTPTDAVTSVNLCPLAKGTDENDRVGSQVSARRVRVNATLRAGASSTETSFTRVIIAVKKAPGNFDASTYFETTTGHAEVTSLRNFDNMSHYKTLYDEVHMMAGSSSPQYSGSKLSVSIPVPKYLATMQWDGAGNHESNSIWLLMVSNMGTNQPEITYTTRVEYADA